MLFFKSYRRGKPLHFFEKHYWNNMELNFSFIEKGSQLVIARNVSDKAIQCNQFIILNGLPRSFHSLAVTKCGNPCNDTSLRGKWSKLKSHRFMQWLFLNIYTLANIAPEGLRPTSLWYGIRARRLLNAAAVALHTPLRWTAFAKPSLAKLTCSSLF